MAFPGDVEGAIAKVEEYAQLWARCETIVKSVGLSRYESMPEYQLCRTLLQERIGLVEKIAERVDERLAASLRSGGWMSWEFSGQDGALNELLGRLRGIEEEERILGVAGPKLAAASLHPWVWSAAAGLWDKGERNAAITAAAKSIFDVQLPAKLRHPDPRLTGTKLVAAAFNLAPSSASDPRLRVTVVARTDPSWNDAQEGALSFGRGVSLGIRNLFVHGLHEPDEQEALEQLAALSLLARWIDSAVRVDDST